MIARWWSTKRMPILPSRIVLIWCSRMNAFWSRERSANRTDWRACDLGSWSHSRTSIAELAKIKDSYNCDGLSIAAATAAMGCQDWLGEIFVQR